MAGRSIFDVMDEADRAKWGAQILYFVAGLPLSISLVVAIASYENEIDASLRYFELAAQIIPLLVLALVIEQRFFFQEFPISIPESPTGPTRAQWNRMRRKIYRYQAGVLLVLAGGEVAALWSVGSVETSRLTFAATTAGLTAGALAMLASSAKGVLTSFGEREIAKINQSLKGRFEKERDDRLAAWKLFIEHANGNVPKRKRAEFEEKMKQCAELIAQSDFDLATEHFPEELERLSQREKQGNLTSGEQMALRLMRQVKP